MREISTRGADEVRFTYRFPGPVRYADIRYSGEESRLESLRIRFGNGRNVEIAKSVLRCFSFARIRETFFLFLPPDRGYPRPEDNWWSAVAIPFGRDLSAIGSNSTNAAFPYVQFEIVGWQLRKISIQRSADEVRTVLPPFKKCPEDDIEWALQPR